MSNLDFVLQYTKTFSDLITVDNKTGEKLLRTAELFRQTQERGGTVFLLGNGGSNSIASHLAVDLTKNAGVKASCFSDGSLISCLSNDFGHDRWMEKAIELHARKLDFVVLISSSGNSENIVNAAKYCQENQIGMVTLTGMSPDNRLNQLVGTDVNFWVDSFAYNHIEMVHQFYLLTTVDILIGQSVYPSVRT